MPLKSRNNGASGVNKKPGEVIVTKIIGDLFSIRVNDQQINPLLIPEKIKGIQKNHDTSLPYDILDMKSKKLISELGQNVISLAAVNPLEEGGFGLDHPGADLKNKSKKKLKKSDNAEITLTLSEYDAMLRDLKAVMIRLAADRELVYTTSFA